MPDKGKNGGGTNYFLVLIRRDYVLDCVVSADQVVYRFGGA